MQQLEFNKTPSPEYSQVKVAFPLMRQSGSEECNDQIHAKTLVFPTIAFDPRADVTTEKKGEKKHTDIMKIVFTCKIL